MARNSEKAMTALARWRRMKELEDRGPISKRPHDVRECKSVNDADRFRREVIGDISKKIAAIQVSSFIVIPGICSGLQF
jgi:pre-mRNA-splicing factor ISY1